MGAIDAVKGTRKGSATSGEALGWMCRYASLAIGGGGTATAVASRILCPDFRIDRKFTDFVPESKFTCTVK